MFNINIFTALLRQENPNFSRFTKSSLAPLIRLLEIQPNPLPNDVWAAVNQIPKDKWIKYQRSLNYLLEFFPGSVILNVPFVTQQNIGGAVQPDGTHQASDSTWNDWTGCWYASACMVNYFYGAGPRQGLPELFNKIYADGSTGHFATGSAGAFRLLRDHHRILARREQLGAVARCDANYDFTYYDLNKLLREGGPIFIYWHKTGANSTYGHASVIIGVDNDQVVYHDPENAPNSRMSINDFNRQRQVWEYAMMQRG